MKFKLPFTKRSPVESQEATLREAIIQYQAENGEKKDLGSVAFFSIPKPGRENQDAGDVTKEGAMVICDGIGGVERGRNSSDTTATLISNAFNTIALETEPTPDVVTKAIYNAFQESHVEQLELNRLHRAFSEPGTKNLLGTTACAFYPLPHLGIAVLVSVGDTRATIWDEQRRLVFQTQDDNFSYQTPADSPNAFDELHYRMHLQFIASQATGKKETELGLLKTRNTVYHSIGDPDIDVLVPHVELVPFDPSYITVMASDGLFDNLTYDEILAALAQASETGASPGDVTEGLCALALHHASLKRNQRAKYDDITVGIYAPRGVHFKITTSTLISPHEGDATLLRKKYGRDLFDISPEEALARIRGKSLYK
jgi:serine/threonine protein phosphatase PrpC